MKTPEQWADEVMLRGLHDKIEKVIAAAVAQAVAAEREACAEVAEKWHTAMCDAARRMGNEPSDCWSTFQAIAREIRQRGVAL